MGLAGDADVVMDEVVVGAVVVVEVNMEVAEGREAVASFMRPQIPLVTFSKKSFISTHNRINVISKMRFG